jgi:hypothetical protein
MGVQWLPFSMSKRKFRLKPPARIAEQVQHASSGTDATPRKPGFLVFQSTLYE